MVADKDIDDVLRLLPEQANYYFTQPATPRAMLATDLQARWQRIHPNTHSLAFTTVNEAIKTAYANAHADDVVFIGGSNYLVGEVLRTPLPAFHN